jgi:TolB protein
MIAFSSTKSGHSNLWIKQVMGGDQIQITRGDWTDLTPTWSPDGQQIAFLSNRGNQHGIWLSLSHGGTPTLLKTLDGESKFLSRWSKDGKTIYYELDHNFYALDIDSKRTSQLTNFDSSKAFSRNFSISLDENWITYADSKNGQFDIWMMPVGEGAPRQVTNDSYSDMYPTWHPDGTKIIYSSDRGASYQICIAYLDGREPKQITFTGGDSVTPDVSPDGARILFTTFKEESDLRGVRTDGGAEFEITSEVGLAVWPDASPDGKLIVFQAGGSERLPSGQILARAISTGDQEIPFASNGFDSRWSPDGSKVAFLRFLGDRFNLWTINATGGEPNQLTSDGLRPSSFRQLPLNRARDGGYRWSPDSSKLAYCSTSSDQRNIWTVSADGSIHTKISNNADPGKAFMHPLWSRAGARIASVLAPRSASVNESDSWSVWVSDLGSIFQHPYCLWLIGWSSSDNSLIVASTEDKNGFKLTDVALLQISLEGSSRSIAQLKLAYPDNIELSPDGKSVAYVSRQDGLDNVWMVSTGGGPAMKLTTNTDPRLYLSTLTWSPNGKAIYYGKQTRSSQVSVIENFK